MLVAERLSKRYRDKAVLDDVSFEIKGKEFVSIVGPSGEGKSTIARILCGTVKPDSGTVLFQGVPLLSKEGKYTRGLHKEIQLIPQQPYASLDPRQSIGDAISEPLRFYKIARSKAEASIKVK